MATGLSLSRSIGTVPVGTVPVGPVLVSAVPVGAVPVVSVLVAVPVCAASGALPPSSALDSRWA